MVCTSDKSHLLTVNSWDLPDAQASPISMRWVVVILLVSDAPERGLCFPEQKTEEERVMEAQRGWWRSGWRRRGCVCVCLLLLFFVQGFSSEEETQGATFSSFELTKDLDKFISFFVLLF